MALRTSDTEGDKKNPSQAGYEKLVSGKQADELHDRVYGDDVRRGVAEAEAAASGAPGVNGRDLKDSEEKGTWDNGVEGKPEDKKKGGFFGFVRSKKGATTMVTTGLVGGGIMTTIFFGGLLAPITFFQNITDDLNDQLAALDERRGHVLRNKLTGTAATKGCTVLSIRCKMKTMSDREMARYKRAGIELSGVKNVFGRTAITQAVYMGEAMDAQAFYNRYQEPGGSALRRAVFKANNMKVLGLSDSVFVDRTLKRFGITRKARELRGNHADRVNELMNRAKITNADELRFTPVEGDDGEERFKLDGDSDPDKTYSTAEVEEMKNSISKFINMQNPSTLKSVGIKSVNVLGWYDLACTFVNVVGMAGVAAKISNSMQMAQYSMAVATLSGKLQSGDASPEDAAVLGEFVTGTDQREFIFNVDQTVSSVGSNGEVVTNEEPTRNTFYGKSAIDADLVKMSSYGDIPAPSANRLAYSLGFGQNSFLKGVSVSADTLRSLANLGTDGSVCKFVQHGLTRVLGMIAGVALTITTVGGSLALSAGVSAAIAAGIILASTVLNAALSQNLFDGGMEEDPQGRANATWTGQAVILGEAGKNRAMMPGNKKLISEYQQLQNKSLQEYIAMEAEEAGPFSLTSRYSFIGSFIHSLSQYIKPSAKISSLIPGLGSTVFSSFSKALGWGSVSAQSINPERFDQCEDDEYEKLGIDADVQCNIRYVMPGAALAIGMETALGYMESNGYVEVDPSSGETITGLPTGYTPPEPEESQGMAMDILNGFASQFYVDRYNGMTSKERDYAQFLDFCVYRTMPFGETYEESGVFGDAPSGYKNGKNCVNTTEEKYHYFRIFTFDKSTLGAISEDEEDALGDGGDGFTLPSGTAIELAKKIIASGNVTDGTRQGQIKRVSNGQSPIPGSGLSVDTKVLALIAGSAEAGNKFRVSSMARNYIPPGGSTTSRHLSGRAFDVAGSINGVVVNYNTHSSVIQEFINQMASVMPNNCEIGVPNRQYVNETKKVAPNGCSVFVDIGTGAHLHFGVP